MSSNSITFMDDMDSHLYSQIHYTDVNLQCNNEHNTLNSSQNLEHPNSTQSLMSCDVNIHKSSYTPIRKRYWSSNTYSDQFSNHYQNEKYYNSNFYAGNQNNYNKDASGFQKNKYAKSSGSNFHYTTESKQCSIPFNDKNSHIRFQNSETTNQVSKRDNSDLNSFENNRMSTFLNERQRSSDQNEKCYNSNFYVGNQINYIKNTSDFQNNKYAKSSGSNFQYTTESKQCSIPFNDKNSHIRYQNSKTTNQVSNSDNSDLSSFENNRMSTFLKENPRSSDQNERCYNSDFYVGNQISYVKNTSDFQKNKYGTSSGSNFHYTTESKQCSVPFNDKNSHIRYQHSETTKQVSSRDNSDLNNVVNRVSTFLNENQSNLLGSVRHIKNIENDTKFSNINPNISNKQIRSNQSYFTSNNSSSQKLNICEQTDENFKGRKNTRKIPFVVEESNDVISNQDVHPQINFNNVKSPKDIEVFRPFEYYILQAEFILHSLNHNQSLISVNKSSQIQNQESLKKLETIPQHVQYLNTADSNCGENSVQNLSESTTRNINKTTKLSEDTGENKKDKYSSNSQQQVKESISFNANEQFKVPSEQYVESNEQESTLENIHTKKCTDSQFSNHNENRNSNICSTVDPLFFIDTTPTSVFSITNINEKTISQPNSTISNENKIMPNKVTQNNAANIGKNKKKKTKKKNKSTKKNKNQLINILASHSSIKSDSKVVANSNFKNSISNQINEIINLDSSSDCDDVVEIAAPPVPIVDLSSDCNDSDVEMCNQEKSIEQLTSTPKPFINDTSTQLDSKKELNMADDEVSNIFTSPSSTKKKMDKSKKKSENTNRVLTPESTSRVSDISCDDFICNELSISDVQKNHSTFVFNIEEQPIINDRTLRDKSEQNTVESKVECTSRISDTSSDDFIQDELAILNQQKDSSLKKKSSEINKSVHKPTKSKKSNRNQLSVNNESSTIFSFRNVYETESSSDMIDINPQVISDNIENTEENNSLVFSTNKIQTSSNQTDTNDPPKQKRYGDLDLNTFEHLITSSQKPNLDTNETDTQSNDTSNCSASKKSKKLQTRKKKDSHTDVVSIASKLIKCKKLKTKSTLSLNTSLNLDLTDSTESSDEAELNESIDNSAEVAVISNNNLTASTLDSSTVLENNIVVNNTTPNLESDVKIEENSTINIKESNRTVEVCGFAEIKNVSSEETQPKEELVVTLDKYNAKSFDKNVDIIELSSDEENSHKPVSRKRKHSESNVFIELSDVSSDDTVVLDNNVDIVINVNNKEFSRFNYIQHENEPLCNTNDTRNFIDNSDNKNPSAETSNTSLENNKNLPTGSQHERSFEENWMLDRDSFYNDSWGEEAYDVHKIRHSMSKSPNAWQMPLDRYHVRDVSRSSVRCLNCRQIGHRKSSCPRPVKSCGFCGSKAHQETRCSMACCLNCFTPNRRGSGFINFCNSCNKDKNSMCYVCSERGHTSDRCPSVWRQYHSTITNGPLKTFGNEVNKVKKKNWWCSGCAKQGHLSYYCHEFKYKTDLPLHSPFISNYKDAYRDCPPAKRRKLNENNDYIMDPWYIHQATYNKQIESFILKNENGIKVVPLTKKKSKKLKKCRENAEVNSNINSVIENDSNLEIISDEENSILAIDDLPTEDSKNINNESKELNKENNEMVKEREENIIKKSESEKSHSNLPTSCNKELNNDAVKESRESMVTKSEKGERSYSGVPNYCNPDILLPSFIPLCGSPDDVYNSNKNVKYNKQRLLVQDNTVSNSEIINLPSKSGQNIARIIISSEEREKMLSHVGQAFIKHMYELFKVHIFVDSENDLYNCLHIEGSLESQYKVQEQLRDLFKIKENEQKDSDMKLLKNIPKNIGALKGFLSNFVNRINKFNGNLNGIYELAMIHSKEIIKTKSKSNYVRSAKKKRSVEYYTSILDKLIRQLNMLLFGKAELEEGKKHVQLLKGFIKELNHMNRNEIASIDKRMQIAVSYQYFCTARDFSDYDRLINQYFKNIHLSRYKKTSVSDSKLNTCVDSIDKLLYTPWVIRNVELKKLIGTIKKKITSKKNADEKDAYIINALSQLYH